MTQNLRELEIQFPDLPWRKPLPVNWTGPLDETDNSVTCTQTYACRVCIANHGFNKRSPHHWPTECEAQAHISKEHLP